MPQHFGRRVWVGSDIGGITTGRIVIRSGHTHDATGHVTGLRERQSALRRRQFDSDSTMIRVSEPTPFGTVSLESSAILFSLGYNPSCGEPCGTESADSKAVALFQKGQSGSSCSAPFWNSSLDHFVTLPTRQQFKCDSPESTVLQDRLRMNCRQTRASYSKSNCPQCSGYRQVHPK